MLRLAGLLPGADGELVDSADWCCLVFVCQRKQYQQRVHPGTFIQHSIVFILSLVICIHKTGFFIPMDQTVVSSSVHSSSLGRVTGIIEAGWPLSSLLGLPLVGVVLKRASWTAWFSLLLSLHALAGLFLLRQFTLLRERQQKEDRLPGKNDSTESEKLTNQSKNSSYSSSTSAATSSTPSPSTFSPSPSILSIITDSLTHFRAVLSHVPALITIFLGMTMSCLTTLNNASLGLWLEVRWLSFVFGNSIDGCSACQPDLSSL